MTGHAMNSSAGSLNLKRKQSKGRHIKPKTQERENRHTTTVLPRELSMATKRGWKNHAAAKRSTARLGAHQAWSRKVRARRKWMIRSVLMRLPDRPALSEHQNTAACPLCRVAGNQQKLQTRKRTSERWPHPISLGSSWSSPLVSELWLRVSLNDQDQATFRTSDWR